MSTDDAITDEDRERMREILEERSEYANDAGHWDSVDEAPDGAVESVVEVMRDLAAREPDRTRCVKASQLCERVDPLTAHRKPSTSWIGRVCKLLASTENDYEVNVERVTRCSGVNGSTWRVDLRDQQ